MVLLLIEERSKAWIIDPGTPQFAGGAGATGG
jgi:hypothetical protein